MNMKKRLLAFSLVFVFLMSSLIGCGSKGASATTMTETLKQTQAMKTGTYNYTFALKLEDKMINDLASSIDESMKQVVVDVLKAEYQMQSTVESMSPLVMSAKISMKKAGSDKAIPVTTVLVKDDAYYINMAEIRELLNSFDNPMVAMVGGMLTTKEDYLKLTVDDMNKAMQLTGEDALTSLNGDMAEYAQNVDSMSEFYVMVSDIFEKVVKDVTPAPVSNESGKVILNINKENYAAVINAVCEDVIKNKETYLDQTIAIFEKVDSMKESVESLKADKAATLEKMQKFCEETMTSIKEDPLTDTDDLNIKVQMSVTGGEGSRELTSDYDFKIKSIDDELGEFEFGFFGKGNGKEKIADADRIKVPEKSTSLEEFTTSLGASLGQ